MKRATGSILAGLALALAAPSAIRAANSAPQAVPIGQSVPDPRDLPWPGGPITLEVDVTDHLRGIARVTQTIPLAQGTRQVTLLYPQWLPGNHAPTGPIMLLSGLQIFADGARVPWRRDPVELFAFHVEVPAGTRQLVASFIHTAPLQTSEGRVTMTGEIVNLQWEKVSLYPAGHYVRQIRVRPSVVMPAGWTVAGALDGVQQSGQRWAWAETSYDTLVDSPLYAGKHFRKWDLGNRVTLNVVADRPELLAATPAQIAAHRALVDEALLAFTARHFDRYEFLLALTDRLSSNGLEHHRSSENTLEPGGFTAWDENESDRVLLPHEFAHSWVGKYRRPARLWTPDYRQPMQGDLLWAYEGLDEFWGLVLAARSGLQSKSMVLGQLASIGGKYSGQAGRQWRSIEDTGHDPAMGYRNPKPWPSFARERDYYSESALIWLEADQVIRSGTGGRRSIDDFARVFFGMNDGDWGELPFELRDLVAALNQVHPHDWDAFLRQRLMTPGQPAPVAGIVQGGYRLVWKEQPNPYDVQRMAKSHSLALIHSLGLTLDKDAKATAVEWDSPAFNAGIVPGAKIVAVNGSSYSPEALKAAITAAKGGPGLELIVQRGTRFQTLRIDYLGGLRWPWLERAAPGTEPTGLDRLLAPRRPRT